MIKKWKFLKRRVLLEHARIVVVEDTVELPNGKHTDYVLEAPSNRFSVALVVLNERGELLVQREFSYPPNEILYQLPGGGGYESETIVEASNRELSEECGYLARSFQVIGSFYGNNRRSNTKQFVVVCKNLVRHQTQADPEEFIENRWMPLADVQKLIANGEVNNVNMLAAMQLFSTINLSDIPSQT